MKRSIALVSLALAALSQTACVDDGYGRGDLYVGSAYPYYGYYDDYYGPIYDGYWGTDNYFYYRHSQNDRSYRRGDRNHFRRGGENPGEHFRPLQGDMRPQQGTRMPHFEGRGDNRGHPDQDHKPH